MSIRHVSDDCQAFQECSLPGNAAGVSILSAEVARELVNSNVNSRGKTVTDVPVDEVARDAVPWTCLVGCYRTCEVDGPFRKSGTDRHPVSPDTWEMLGFAGDYDPVDPAFRFAGMTLALGLRAERAEDELVLERVRSGLVDQPPSYVEDLSAGSVEAALREADLEPELWPDGVAVLRRSGVDPDHYLDA